MTNQGHDLLKWRLTLAETLAFGVTVATLVLWLSDKFQSKDEGFKIEKRVENLEIKISNLSDGINSIAKDLSYIRGRLEPSSKDK